MRFRCATLVLIMLLGLVALPFSAVSQTITGKSDSGTKKWLSAIKRKPAQSQQQFAAYWTTEPGWRTELQLRNNMVDQSLTVTPVARTSDGKEIPLSAVTLQPNEVQSLDLHALLTSNAPQLIGGYGSLVLRYNSPFLRNLYAVAMVHDGGYPIEFHLDGEAQEKAWKKGSREGIWWFPNTSATNYLILTNLADHAISGALSLYDASGRTVSQTIQFPARSVQRFSLRDLIRNAGFTGSIGGVQVGTNDGAGSLDSVSILFDESAAFGAVLKMFDHNPDVKLEERDFANKGKWTTRAPMLALATPDPFLGFPQGTVLEPQLLLRNTTAAPLKIGLAFNWRSTSSTGKVSLPEFTLRSHETRKIDVKALQDAGTIPEDANWASVALVSNGAPDDLMAVAASYDHTLRYGAQTPFSDQLSIHMEGGQWQVDSTHNSLIAAGNGSPQTIKAALTFFYNHGQSRYTLERTLAPQEQMWIDVGQLIHNQTPDKDGKVLPVDLTEGSYQLLEIEPHTLGSLYEGKVIIDKTFGHAAYGCMICCGVGSGQFAPDPWTGYVGFAAAGNIGTQDACNGASLDDGYYYTTWWTDNAGVTTAAPSQFTGVGGGSTNGYAQGRIPIGDGVDVGRQRSCPVMTDKPQQVTNVQIPTDSRIVSDLTNASNLMCAPGQAGWFRRVRRTVMDQFGKDITVDGQQMGELVTKSLNGLGLPDPPNNVSTTTSGGGLFDDIYSFCTSQCPANGGETDLNQQYLDVMPGQPTQYVLNSLSLVYKCTGISVSH